MCFAVAHHANRKREREKKRRVRERGRARNVMKHKAKEKSSHANWLKECAKLRNEQLRETWDLQEERKRVGTEREIERGKGQREWPATFELASCHSLACCRFIWDAIKAPFATGVDSQTLSSSVSLLQKFCVLCFVPPVHHLYAMHFKCPVMDTLSPRCPTLALSNSSPLTPFLTHHSLLPP